MTVVKKKKKKSQSINQSKSHEFSNFKKKNPLHQDTAPLQVCSKLPKQYAPKSQMRHHHVRDKFLILEK